MSLCLKWDSARQHIYGSCLCIHSAKLYLLVGTFNPFTFKVIAVIYVPIDVFLVVCHFCNPGRDCLGKGQPVSAASLGKRVAVLLADPLGGGHESCWLDSF